MVSTPVRVVIDRELCAGSLMCVSLAPGVMTLTDGQATATAILDVSPDLASAVECCPTQAIRILRAGDDTHGS